jgi:hypothetical protein
MERSILGHLEELWQQIQQKQIAARSGTDALILLNELAWEDLLKELDEHYSLDACQSDRQKYPEATSPFDIYFPDGERCLPHGDYKGIPIYVLLPDLDNKAFAMFALRSAVQLKKKEVTFAQCLKDLKPETFL